MTKNQKIFSLICLLIFAFPLQAENITLVVEGIGDSKANALFDAQTNALRASYGGFISTNRIALPLTKLGNILLEPLVS